MAKEIKNVNENENIDELLMKPNDEQVEEPVEELIESEEVPNEIDEVVEPITTEEEPKPKENKIKYNKNIDFEGRGFSSFDEAVKFIETDCFKGLGKEDQEEYLNWLKN